MDDTAARIAELERRVASLEGTFEGKWPPDVCRFCGERALRLASADFDEKGNVQEYWKCAACGKTDLRATRPPR
jgi:hypothetical protein